MEFLETCKIWLDTKTSEVVMMLNLITKKSLELVGVKESDPPYESLLPPRELSEIEYCITRTPRLFDEDECIICLDPQENKSFPPCGHVFCFECLVQWCEKKLECPTCRQRFRDFLHSDGKVEYDVVDVIRNREFIKYNQELKMQLKNDPPSSLD